MKLLKIKLSYSTKVKASQRPSVTVQDSIWRFAKAWDKDLIEFNRRVLKDVAFAEQIEYVE